MKDNSKKTLQTFAMGVLVGAIILNACQIKEETINVYLPPVKE